MPAFGRCGALFFGRLPLGGELVENHAYVAAEAHVVGLVEVGEGYADAPPRPFKAVAVEDNAAGF